MAIVVVPLGATCRASTAKPLSTGSLSSSVATVLRGEAVQNLYGKDHVDHMLDRIMQTPSNVVVAVLAMRRWTKPAARH